MKKNMMFFLKLSAVICTVAVLIGIINFKYIHGNYYTDVYNEVKKFEHVPNHITFANFGTSHGLAAFRYDKEDTASFNFALSGEDIYHDFQTLKQFSNHLDKGCIVSIPVSYFSFCLPDDEPSQKRYYTYLDKEYLIGFSYETLINTKYVPVLRSIEFLFKDLIGDQEINIENFMDAPTNQEKAPHEQNDSDVNEKNMSLNTSANTAKIQMLNEHAVTRAESWRSGRMVLGKKYIKSNTQLLIDMIQYCKEHEFQPVLLTIPVYSSLTDAFTKEELEMYYFSNIEEVVKETGITYFDYSKDDKLINNPSYYNNSDHMSDVGGQAFLEIYKNDLASNGYVAY